MAIDETTLKSRMRNRGITTSDVSDAELDSLIDDALEEYSSYRPNLTFTAESGWLTTIINEPSYTFPTGATKIISVFWNPDYSDSYVGDIYGEILLDILDATDTTEIMIEYRKMAQMRRYFGGSWYILNGKIFLVPAPSISDIKVPVIYATIHTLSTLNQISDHLFYDLVYAYCLERKAFALSSSGGWKAGAYAVTPQAGAVMHTAADKKLNEVRTRLMSTGHDPSIAGFPSEVII